MADRSVRSLTSLGGASSSRVLNLIAIGQSQAGNCEHQINPMFLSPVINNAIILKHRLRADELDLFTGNRASATKVIIPFERSDLRVGGQSFFVDQRGFERLLEEAGNYRNPEDMARDIAVLRLIDGIPSLDPFLLREHLRGNDFAPDSSYFQISPADQQRMHEYAALEVGRLTRMASGREGHANNAATGRMVAALLSNEVNEKLEPLRLTLNLAPDEFSEGVFSWRGFIYYKWHLKEFWPSLIEALRDMKTIRPSGRADIDQIAYLTSCKNQVLRAAQESSNDVRKVIAIYDNAYASLIERQDPKMFRDFLLSAPKLFVEIGERMGAMSHITSFWRYRFPLGAAKTADADELTCIFQDFINSFGTETIQIAA